MKRLGLIFGIGIFLGAQTFGFGQYGLFEPINVHPRFNCKAIVSSADTLATLAGLEMLRAGGNAIDAAVATEFTLAVTYPQAGNVGGGGFMVIRLADGTTDALDYRERAPLAARPDMYLDNKGRPIAGLSWEGGKAVGVPGTVAGMAAAHKKYGKLPWKSLLQPAIQAAKFGFRINAELANDLNRNQAKFIKHNPRGCAFIKADGWKAGDELIQKDLAETLEQIAEAGDKAFYYGLIPQAIVQATVSSGGILTEEDFRAYRPVFRKPLSGSYRGYTVTTMPPPSSGGIALLQLLTITEQFPIKTWGRFNPQTLHLMIEAQKRVFADRNAYVADPDFVYVPVQRLLDKNYILDKFTNFSMTRATPTDSIKPGNVYESDQTTHYSIVDESGNAVAVTTTLNGLFGSFIVAAGMLLNNEMDDFSAKPGFPNRDGLRYSVNNGIAPGKRMLSSMTPTILSKDGKLFAVLGSPGGPTIINTVYQTVVNLIDFEMNADSAADTERLHHQLFPKEVIFEEGLFKSEATKQTLELYGHQFRPVEAIGRVNIIRTDDNGRFEGAADRRGRGLAAGY